MSESFQNVWSTIECIAPNYRKAGKFIAIDTETTGTNFRAGGKSAEVFAISACDYRGKTFFIRGAIDQKTHRLVCREKGKDFDQVAAEWFAKINLHQYDRIVFHNAKFDILALRNLLCSVLGEYEDLVDFFKPGNIEFRDTLIYSHVLNSYESHGLKDLGDAYLPPELGLNSSDEAALKEAVRRARRTQKYVDTSRPIEADYWRVGDELKRYAINDAKRTALLYAAFCELLDDKLAKQVAREHLLLSTIYLMEDKGIRLLRKSHTQLLEKFSATSLSSRESLRVQAKKQFKISDFNPASSQQLADVLHNRYKLPVNVYTQGGKPATGAACLDEHLEFCEQNPRKWKKASQFIEKVRSLRKADKGVSYLKEYKSLVSQEIIESFGKKLVPDGTTHIEVIHTSINQTGTDTTRCSSSGPNMQNVSTKEDLPLRKVFGPRPGCFWVDADFENIELRIPAYVSGDKRLIEAFEKGVSVHEIIAEELNGPKAKWKTLNKADWKKSPEYKRTKNGNFALIYGASPRKADATYGVDGAYERLCKRFSKLMKLMQSVIEKAEKNRYVETLWGYRLYVPPRRAYCAFNYFVQGSAGDAMKYALLCVDNDVETWKRNGELLLTVHDELIVELPHSGLNRAARFDYCGVCADRVKYVMEEPGRNIGIPLTASAEIVLTNWASPTKLKDLISQ